MSTIALPEDAIGTAHAGRLVLVSACTVWRWITAGHVRGWRVRGRWFVSEAEVRGLVVPSTPRPDVAERAEAEARVAKSLAVLDSEGIR
jgi:hypothetical protein